MPTGKGVLRIAIEDFLETFGFGKRIQGWFVTFLEFLEDAWIGIYAALVRDLYPNQKLPPPFDVPSMSALIKGSQNGFFVGLLAIAGMIAGGVFGFGQPSSKLAAYFMDSQIRSYRPQPNELPILARRHAPLSSELKNLYKDLGVADVLQQAIEDASHPILPPDQLEVLRRKGAISDADYTAELTANGLTPERIKQVQALRDLIPSVTDLITLQVKEAFNDEFSARFNHDEGDISQVTEWAVKQGLSPEWVKRYWRAHWQLPSPNQVFEMLQRLRPGKSNNPVTDEDVKQYLQMADYSPFWRDRLKEIAYSPFTRVDIRRMYQMKILDEKQVLDAYLDAGYNQERAEALTKFTVAFETETETGIGRSAVMSAYDNGMIDRATAEKMLSDVGYDATSIAFYLNNIDFQLAQQVNQIKLANIKKKYVEGMIDETTVNSEINLLNLPAERVSALLELWNTERANQVTLLTISQMEVLLERGIVSDADYKEIAKKRGYDDKSITWTLARIAGEAAQKAKDDAEKAAADNERVQKSQTASKYQKNKAEYDLSIAQAKAEITDINIALQSDVTEDEQTTLIERKKELTQFIADLNVKKAQLRLDTSTIIDNLNKQ